MSSREVVRRTRRRIAATILALLAVSAAGSACGELELVEFTRATTTTEDPETLEPDGEGQPGEWTLTTLRPARYLVQPGDSLAAIAEEYGVGLDALMAANNISDPNLLEAGVYLVIPQGDASLPAPWQQGQTQATSPTTIADEPTPQEPTE